MQTETKLLLLKKYISDHPIDVVRSIEKLDLSLIVDFLNECPADLIAKIFPFLSSSLSARCFEKLELEKQTVILENIPISIGAVIIRNLPEENTKPLFLRLSNETSQALSRFLAYPESSIGALVDPDVFTLPQDIDADEALKRLKIQQRGIIPYIFVLSREQALTGMLTFDQLFKSDPSAHLFSIMNTQVPSVPAQLSYASALNHHGWLEYQVLPVVDGNDLFLGVVRYRDVLKMHTKQSDSSRNKLIATGNALGELYRIGISSFLSISHPQNKERINK